MSTYAVNPAWRGTLASLGLDPAAVLRRAGLPAGLLQPPGVRIRAEDFFALWEAAEALSPGPDFAIRAAEAVSADELDVPVRAGLASRDVAQAAERIAAYKRLVYPVALDVRTNNGLRIALRPRAPFTPPSVLERFELLFWVAFARLATGVRVRPARVTIPIPPRRQEAVESFLDGVVFTPGHRAEIVFSQVDMHRPFVCGHHGLWEELEPQLRSRLHDLEQSAAWSERTHAALLRCLPARRTLAETAAELATSPRTLQRRLEAEGTSFQEVLAHTRERLARAYLQRSTLSYPDIAFLVGYDELTSFHRSLRNWTGETPRGLRLHASP
ncbi:AraC family transcriptional regulator ligand-binding domain-containing protein [Streptomyces sp. TR06-5]|uniref:AraC family transcriptional regulator n=1 Tax=Streptomyces sp. TR06-5 TaxID=3385976 RepID=UPI00399FAF0C